MSTGPNGQLVMKFEKESNDHSVDVKPRSGCSYTRRIAATEGILRRDQNFYYNGKEINIVNTFSYLGVVFSRSGSFSDCQKTLTGQAQKSIFKLNRYLYMFTNITPKHKLELFDKLISPIPNYYSEVLGFCQASQVERIHMLFCKQLLGLKTSTQNDYLW